MRKFACLFGMILLVTVFLSACKNTGTAPGTSAVTPSTTTEPSSSTPKEKEAPAPAANTAPEVKASAGKTFANINSDKMSFDQATESFFNGDVDAALNKMEPLLYSAAATEASLQTSLFYAGIFKKTVILPGT
jgi:hypothetical protein